MLKIFAVICFLICLAPRCSAQGACYAAPGASSLYVPLVPNSMEPACEPQRIRVPDRTQVTLHIRNISPTEYCTPTASAATPTAVTNPIESIINTVSGLKSFSLVQSSDFLREMGTISALIEPDTGQHLTEAEKNAPHDPQAVLFQKLAAKVLPAAQMIATKQSAWQSSYQTDLIALQDYLNGNYRAENWTKFDPQNASALDGPRNHIIFPPITADSGDMGSPPSEMDFVPLQALIDQLKALQPQLISACTSALVPNSKKKCNPEVLATTSKVIDQANAYLSVATDNLHTLQTTQTGIVSAYNALVAQKHLFDNRLNAGAYRKITDINKYEVLEQNIPLGTNYGAASAGSVSCATTASPSVATPMRLPCQSCIKMFLRSRRPLASLSASSSRTNSVSYSR